MIPTEVVTDRAAIYPGVVDELLADTWHIPIGMPQPHRGRHGRFKARLRAMRGLKQEHSLWILVVAHALVHNVRRGHYELTSEVALNHRLMVAFEQLALAL